MLRPGDEPKKKSDGKCPLDQVTVLSICISTRCLNCSKGDFWRSLDDVLEWCPIDLYVRKDLIHEVIECLGNSVSLLFGDFFELVDKEISYVVKVHFDFRGSLVFL